MNGSKNKVAMTIIAVVLVAVLGFVGWQVFARGDGSSADTSQKTPSAKEETKDVEEDPTPEEGTISGSLTYPAESIPSDIEIHAYNIDTKHDYFVKDHKKDTKYPSGEGYEISVPTGTY